MIDNKLFEEISKEIGLRTKGGITVTVLEIKNEKITGRVGNPAFGSLTSWDFRGKETSGKKWLDLDLSNPDK